MYEIEIKIKIRNLQEIKEKLKSLNAKSIISLEQRDTYYNSPDGMIDFSKTDEALRIRYNIEKDKNSLKIIKKNFDLTYKGPKLDKKIKSRVEFVCNLLDPEKMDSILLALGYKKVITILKQRDVYKVQFKGNEIECLIDQVDNFSGFYFEAELMTEDKKKLDTIKKIIFNFIENLGYKEKDSIVDSYLELILKKKGVIY